MFYERLKALLKEKGLSDKQFLADINMGRNQMTNWKNGNIPNKSTLIVIANYFGVPVDYLLGVDERNAELRKEALDLLDDTTDQEKALLDMFRSTSEKGRLRIIQAVMNICDEEEKKSASSNTSVTD